MQNGNSTFIVYMIPGSCKHTAMPESSFAKWMSSCPTELGLLIANAQSSSTVLVRSVAMETGQEDFSTREL